MTVGHEQPSVGVHLQRPQVPVAVRSPAQATFPLGRRVRPEADEGPLLVREPDGDELGDQLRSRRERLLHPPRGRQERVGAGLIAAPQKLGGLRQEQQVQAPLGEKVRQRLIRRLDIHDPRDVRRRLQLARNVMDLRAPLVQEGTELDGHGGQGGSFEPRNCALYLKRSSFSAGSTPDGCSA